MIDYNFYDTKYAAGYRSELSGFEIARKEAIQHFVHKVISIERPLRVLDYGAGRGLHVPLWTNMFPSSELFLCDVSSVALQNCVETYPDLTDRYKLIEDNRADFDDGVFDLIVSIEVNTCLLPQMNVLPRSYFQRSQKVICNQPFQVH